MSFIYKNHLKIMLLFLIVCSIISFLFFNKRETIAVIGAMDAEICEIDTMLSHKNYKNYNDFRIITGNIGKYKVILAKSGVGKVASAATTQFIIDKYSPKYIVNIGVAGSLSPRLVVGDVVIAEKMIQHDFDVTAFGNPKGYMDNGIEPNKPTVYYSDKLLVDKFSRSNNIKMSTVATGDIFVVDVKLKSSIRKEFGADLVDMESAAIAQTAKRNNIPVIVIRTVSDGFIDKTGVYKQNKQVSSNKSAKLVLKLIKADK